MAGFTTVYIKRCNSLNWTRKRIRFKNQCNKSILNWLHNSLSYMLSMLPKGCSPLRDLINVREKQKRVESWYRLFVQILIECDLNQKKTIEALRDKTINKAERHNRNFNWKTFFFGPLSPFWIQFTELWTFSIIPFKTMNAKRFFSSSISCYSKLNVSRQWSPILTLTIVPLGMRFKQNF